MRLFFVLGFVFLISFANSQPDAKRKALDDIRTFFAEKPYRKVVFPQDSVVVFKQRLTDEGLFVDLVDAEKKIIDNDYANEVSKQPFISSVTEKAFNRLWCMAEVYRNKQQSETDSDLHILMKSIVHYGLLEHDRINSPSRWHNSCFAVPVASTHIYFSLLDLMNRIEGGSVTDSLYVDANEILGKLSFQSWSVPARMDDTDNNIVSVDRFRKHVWWVGGNATGYRPLLQAAAQLQSCEMADVVAEVSARSISSVTQTTYDDDFWTEGITADGAGWGHGMQCLVWGYPIHGTVGSLQILEIMKDYPLSVGFKKEQIATLLSYIRGSSFYYYKGYIPPVVSRGNMNPLETPYPGRIGNKNTDYREKIPSLSITNYLLDFFSEKLSPEVRDELLQFNDAASRFRIKLPSQYSNNYSGSRYFFNNDDVIKKTDNYYLLVNMASNRVSGLESAKTMAAAFNVFTCDGTTLFFRKGDEYQRVLGALNLRAWPGTTSRLSPLDLKPIENWCGYNSCYGFAAGATSSGSSFSAGFIFEKNNRLWQERNITHDPKLDPNPSAFGVKAYKSYFMFDDVFLAMGCGIENKMPEFEGDIITTIDQTELMPDFINGDFIKNNDFYYTVIDEYTDGDVVVDARNKMTQWQRMCIENKAPEKEESVMHLYINHGHRVENASYAYTVSCTPEALKQQPVVLSNTKEAQAAESFDGNIIGAIFYESNLKINSRKGYFKTSAPCALLVEIKGKEVTITVTDALMDPNLKEITIETSFPLKGANVQKKSTGIYCVEMAMANGQQTGAPVVEKVYQAEK